MVQVKFEMVLKSCEMSIKTLPAVTIVMIMTFCPVSLSDVTMPSSLLFVF